MLFRLALTIVFACGFMAFGAFKVNGAVDPRSGITITEVSPGVVFDVTESEIDAVTGGYPPSQQAIMKTKHVFYASRGGLEYPMNVVGHRVEDGETVYEVRWSRKARATKPKKAKDESWSDYLYANPSTSSDFQLIMRPPKTNHLSVLFPRILRLVPPQDLEVTGLTGEKKDPFVIRGEHIYYKGTRYFAEFKKNKTGKYHYRRCKRDRKTDTKQLDEVHLLYPRSPRNAEATGAIIVDNKGLRSVAIASGADGTEAVNYSPDVIARDDAVYYLMIDRFLDADSSINDQGYGAYDPNSWYLFNGGDFKGVAEKLDYIQGMGFSAICLTPVVRQYPEPVTFAGTDTPVAAYSGHWAYDLDNTEPRFGSKDSLASLIDAANDKGMDVMLSVDINSMSPTQADTDYVYPNFDYADFHHYGPIEDLDGGWTKLWNIQYGDFELTADLATGLLNPQNVLSAKYAALFDDVGAVGCRADVATCVPRSDLAVIFALTREAMTTRAGTMTFMGDVDGLSANQESIAEFCGPYTQSVSSLGEKPLSATYNFQLFTALNDQVFAADTGASYLSSVKTWQFDKEQYSNPYLLSNYLDSYNTPRFLDVHDNNEDILKAALSVIYAWPGVPTVFYATEQSYARPDGVATSAPPYNAPAMWNVKYDDQTFNADAPMYKHIAKLNALRFGANSTGQALRYGDIDEKLSSGHLYAFERNIDDDSVLIVINSSASAQTVTGLTTGLDAGSKTDLIDGATSITVSNGQVGSFELAPYQVAMFGE